MIKLNKYLKLLGTFCCLWSVYAYGQTNALYYNRVEHLRFGDRISLRTNSIDWLTLTPNLGLELTLGDKNWSKWTLGASARVNWKTTSHLLPYNVYDIYAGQVELRKYWHGANPRRVFYWGVYAGANKFDLKLSTTGYKGNAFTGGAMVGTITQLYSYRNGGSLDLDLGVQLGVALAKWDEYQRDLVNERYVYTTTAVGSGYKPTFNPLIYAASTDVLHVSLVYHFGTKVANRYKKREVVDENYRLKLANDGYRRDSLRTEKAKQKEVRAIEKQRERNLKRHAKEEKAKLKAQRKAEKAKKD